MEAKHTPTPWAAIDNRIFSDDYVLEGAPIATIHSRKKHGMQKANAVYIVKCVNQHDELVCALQSLLSADSANAMGAAMKNAEKVLSEIEM